MRLTRLTVTLVILLAAASQVCAVTMTFDDIPEGRGLGYYTSPYNGDTGWGINFTGFSLADHAGSSWWTPHSDAHAALYPESPGSTWAEMMFKKPWMEPPQVLYASSISGYFSTQPGVVVRMVGHGRGQEVTEAVLLGSDQGWNNVYVHLDFPAGMSAVSFQLVAGDSPRAFCMDDVTVTFVPEPSSLLALGGGLLALGGLIRRRR